MAIKYNKEERKIYNGDEEVRKKNVENKKEAKKKKKTNKQTEFGSGRIEYKGSDNNKKMNTLPDIQVLEKEVLKCIIGQDNQVRRIITAIYRMINFKSIKSNVLIIGSSGTGKTETISQIAKLLHLPYTIEDATKYTQEGYYGADVTDMIYNLIENADMDIEKAQSGIIVIDEIDKKASNGEHDVSGAEVLKSLLKIIEGTKIKIPVMDYLSEENFIDFDTKNIIIIFLGAFSGLDKIRNKRLNTNSMGFVTNNASEKIKSKSKYLKRDLVEYGMPEEFVGRIDTIIEMNNLTKQDLALILKKSKLSIFIRYRLELKKRGIKLEYPQELFELIAEESLSLDTGARELSNTVNYIFENIMYDILADQGKFTKCKLSLEIVKDNTKYELS